MPSLSRPSPPSLWLLRHLQTEAQPGQCYGALDLSCAPAEIEAVAQRVALQLPPVLRWHSSPLQRCARLATRLQQLRPEVQLQCDARLAEMDFGAWEGRLWADIPQADIERWTDDFGTAQPGGNGESLAAFLQRVGAAFDDWRRSGEDALWITHAGVMRAVPLIARGVRQLQSADQWPRSTIAYGECLRITLPL